jgi:hypothetical protein
MRSRTIKLRANWQVLKARVRLLFHLAKNYLLNRNLNCSPMTIRMDKEYTYVGCACDRVFYIVKDPDIRSAMIEGVERIQRGEGDGNSVDVELP